MAKIQQKQPIAYIEPQLNQTVILMVQEKLRLGGETEKQISICLDNNNTSITVDVNKEAFDELVDNYIKWRKTGSNEFIKKYKELLEE